MYWQHSDWRHCQHFLVLATLCHTTELLATEVLATEHHPTIISPYLILLWRCLPGNTKGGSITVPLTSYLTGLDLSVLQTKTKIVNCHTADSKPVKQEVNGTVILPTFSIPCVYSKKLHMTMHLKLRKSPI